MALILSVYRGLLCEYCGPADQEFQREAPSAIRRPNKLGVEFWAQHSLQIDLAYVQPTHEATRGKQGNFEHHSSLYDNWNLMILSG